jgi:hypothetical protein
MSEWGAFCFGAVIGWVTYYTMRYSQTHALSDISVVIGAVGGAGILVLFDAKSKMFLEYGVGLATGFFVYVLILIIATLFTSGLRGLLTQGKNPFMEGREPP